MELEVKIFLTLKHDIIFNDIIAGVQFKYVYSMQGKKLMHLLQSRSDTNIDCLSQI